MCMPILMFSNVILLFFCIVSHYVIITLIRLSGLGQISGSTGAKRSDWSDLLCLSDITKWFFWGLLTKSFPVELVYSFMFLSLVLHIFLKQWHLFYDTVYFLNMLYTFLLMFLYFNLYFNVEPLRMSMFVNKETTYLLLWCKKSWNLYSEGVHICQFKQMIWWTGIALIQDADTCREGYVPELNYRSFLELKLIYHTVHNLELWHFDPQNTGNGRTLVSLCALFGGTSLIDWKCRYWVNRVLEWGQQWLHISPLLWRTGSTVQLKNVSFYWSNGFSNWMHAVVSPGFCLRGILAR